MFLVKQKCPGPGLHIQAFCLLGKAVQFADSKDFCRCYSSWRGSVLTAGLLFDCHFDFLVGILKVLPLLAASSPYLKGFFSYCMFPPCHSRKDLLFALAPLFPGQKELWHSLPFKGCHPFGSTFGPLFFTFLVLTVLSLVLMQNSLPEVSHSHQN